MPQVVNIDLNQSHKISRLISVFSEIDMAESLEINILHRRNWFISVHLYPILCSIVNEMRANNVEVIINFETPENCNQLRYAERMNFLDCLGIEYLNPYRRHGNAGRFIEILNVPPRGYDFPIDLLEIFTNDFNLGEAAARDLALIMLELACNTTMHTYSANGSYFYCQKYPDQRFLDIYLVDSGVGIIHTMRGNEEFFDKTDEELLPLSIQFEMGSGNGQGHGLYFVSEFIRRNGGGMLLVSGNYNLQIHSGNLTTGVNDRYKGVILKMRIPFDITVTMDELMIEKEYENLG